MIPTETLMQRANLLLQQHRPDLAEQQLRQVLTQEPNFGRAHSLLAWVLAGKEDQLREANYEADLGVHLAPDESFSYHALAYVLERRGDKVRAREVCLEAIRLNPFDEDLYGLLAQLAINLEKWQEAVDAAEKGLQIDPDDQTCGAMRTLALTRLGRVSDAVSQAEVSIARDPDSAAAHAARGWAMLQRGDYRQAQESFREALRLDPNYEFARDGMIDAINSRNFIFRGFYLFRSKVAGFSQAGRIAIVVGAFLGNRALNTLAGWFPAFEPFIFPVIILYIAVCLLSWILDPLFNIALLVHPFGKHLLRRKEKAAAVLTASCLVLGCLASGYILAFGQANLAWIGFLLPMLLCIPISIAFSCDRGWPTYVASIIAFGMAGLYFMGIGLTLLGEEDFSFACFALFLVGIFLVTIAGQFLLHVRTRR